MRVFLAHIFNIGIAFISSFIFVCALLFVVVSILSFIFWTIPTIPTTETLLFSLRILLAVSAVFTAAYSFSNDYNQFRNT
jgi:formate-dependent nitrite reductase membrane component NrfD